MRTILFIEENEMNDLICNDSDHEFCVRDSAPCISMILLGKYIQFMLFWLL